MATSRAANLKWQPAEWFSIHCPTVPPPARPLAARRSWRPIFARPDFSDPDLAQPPALRSTNQPRWRLLTEEGHKNDSSTDLHDPKFSPHRVAKVDRRESPAAKIPGGSAALNPGHRCRGCPPISIE